MKISTLKGKGFLGAFDYAFSSKKNDLIIGKSLIVIHNEQKPGHVHIVENRVNILPAISK